MRVVALGRTRWLYESIRALADNGHEIVLVGTCGASPEYDVHEEQFAALARELGAPFFVDSNLEHSEPRALLQAAEADIAVSVNWLTLIGHEALGRFPFGVLNGHPGDLPRYRGNASPNWAIIAGEREVVATVHRMIPELDAGPILCRRHLPLDGDTYIGDIYAMLDRAFPELFVEAVNGLAAGTIVEEPQPSGPERSLRGFPRLPQDSELRWERPADELARLVRASAEPFPGAFSYLGQERHVVWRAHAEGIPYPWLGTPGQVAEVRRPSGEVAVLTGSGALVLEDIEIGHRGRSRAADAIHSARIRLGLDVAGGLSTLAARIAELEEQLGGGQTG